MDIFKTYIVPLLIILALSGVFAFLLAFLSEKLKVTRDEKIDQILGNLAGANCGGCGYGGCEAFAEALFKGETTVDKCKPTKKEYKKAISKILGVGLKETEPKVAVVHCNGGKDAAVKAGYQGYGDCQSANLLAGGTKQCEVGCMGLGSCVKACAYRNAVTVSKDRGVAIVNPAACVDCTACIKACPKHIIGEIPADARVYVACSNKCAGKTAVSQCKRSCIACGMCVKACPSGAIKIDQNLARIDYKKCTRCGECVKACPRKCIIDRQNPSLK